MARIHTIRQSIFVAVGLAVLSVLGAGVKMSQTISLVSGWNAVYIEVEPEETADAIFASWPVDKVGYYDPAAFLETKQYSGSVSTEGSVRTGYTMWRRGMPELSYLKNVVPGVYLCFNTNAATATAFTTMLYGCPAAPRITWHPSDTNDAMNLIGFSIAGDAKTPIGDYLNGFTGGNVNLLKFYGINGLSDGKINLGVRSVGDSVSDGQVVVMTCSEVSDWSGVLYVSPMDGLNFSTNISQLAFSIRNDSAKARTVSLELGMGVGATLDDVPAVPANLKLRDTSYITNSWIDFSPEQPFSKVLVVGETVNLRIAVDRTKLSSVVGTYYGGLLTVKDVDGGSNFRVTVPLEVTSDGGASAETAWPKGLWLASGKLNTVTYLEAQTIDGESVLTNIDVKAGGTMSVRLPLYVESNGAMKLLQRFVYGSDTNGTTHIYSPKTESAFPVAIGNVKRVSSAVLPIDAPEISNVEDVSHTVYSTNFVEYATTNIVGDVTNIVVEVETNVMETAVYVTVTNGAFGTQATFPFVVRESSKVNPYRHTFHPSHDGLQWDFETATPSGDNITNYISTVKPEVFSVKNRITFTWDDSSGTSWSPDEKLSGNLLWELDGVRHEGTIRMKGRFTMKRISSVTIDR